MPNKNIRDLLREVPITNKSYPEYIEALAEHLEASGVLLPPVSVRQSVYHFSRDLGAVFPYFVESLNIGSLGKNKTYWNYEANCHDEETDELLDEIDFELDDIGKTVFLTREEAEQALKGAENVEKD